MYRPGSRLVCRVQARQQRVLCSEVPRCSHWLRLKVHPEMVGVRVPTFVGGQGYNSSEWVRLGKQWHFIDFISFHHVWSLWELGVYHV